MPFLHYPAFVNDFTQFEGKLVFSLNVGVHKLMSKL